MITAVVVFFFLYKLSYLPVIDAFLMVWISFLLAFLQVLFFTTCERKILALSQRRVGPTVVGDRGRLQYFADAIKILVKQYTSPRKIHFSLFTGSAIATFWFSWFNFSNLTFNYGEDIADIDFNIFFSVCCTVGFSIAIIVSGWASGSKYALMGCIRAAIQSISYEILMSSVFLCLFGISGSTNFEIFMDQQTNFSIFLFMPALGVISFIATLMETNRPPFDLSEAESDVVAGYSVEYAGVLFGLFYLGEYVNIFANAFMLTILFVGSSFDLFTQLLTIVCSVFTYLFNNCCGFFKLEDFTSIKLWNFYLKENSNLLFCILNKYTPQIWFFIFLIKISFSYILYCDLYITLAVVFLFSLRFYKTLHFLKKNG